MAERPERRTCLPRTLIQVQDQPPFIYVEPSGDLVPINLRQQPTPSIAIGLNSLRFHNYEVIATILCARDPDAFNAWALKTYFAVMQAYQAAKSKYDDAVEAARVAASYNLTVGRNPDENRAIEQAELKRGCITLMSGQRFDAFDSMARNVAPLGYPEIDFDGAKVEARFIRLFEQALEWENMTYLFYPCAVERRRFPVGANPTRQPLQPEATGAVMEVTKWLKPSDSVSRYTVTARVCRP